jgi:hypothetical protein
VAGARAKRAGMRDLVVREALKEMSADAAERLRQLVASGRQIPYDVEEAGSGSAMPQYVPLTARFIRDNASALNELDSFGSGCAAIESAELAAPYLKEIGISVPSDQRGRAELAGVVFLCRLWDGSTDFSLDAERLTRAISEIEAGGEATEDEIEVVVQIRGLQLPIARLELATATIVRADTVEVPADARAPEGGAAGWEPVFLAATRVSAGEPDGDDAEARPDAGARAVEAFRQLITTLRLFKAGSVGLGPYAWTRAGANRWRRISTGSGRARPGGYRLAEPDLAELVAFSRTLAYRSALARPVSGPAGALPRATSRFEAGLERGIALEALNDYLLTLRFLLEGSGPAGLDLSIRVAALCAEPGQRGQIKAVIDRALTLERELWSGEPAVDRDDLPSAAETTATVEDLTRAILADAACGHLGSDLRSTADEILLADGLTIGEGAAEVRGAEEEWETGPEPPDLPEDDRPRPDPEPPGHQVEPIADEPGWGDEPAPAESPRATPPPPEAPKVESGFSAEPSAAPAREPNPLDQLELSGAEPDPWAPGGEEEPQPPPVKVPEPEGRIRMEPRPRPEEQIVFANAQTQTDEPPTTTMEALSRDNERVAELLEELPDDRSPERRPTTDRVAYLFPRPEPTDWNVRELSYDRRRRARV